MEVRKAIESDFNRIMEIYRYAQDYMIESGNPTQWGHFYPDEQMVRNDIEIGACYLICDGEITHGVFTLFDGPDSTYRVIEDGAWLNDDPYVVMHRLAGDGQAHGLFRCALDYCKSITSNIRVDTHNNNLTMQKQIEKNGFTRCGTIYVKDGSPRIAYQWTASDK